MGNFPSSFCRRSRCPFRSGKDTRASCNLVLDHWFRPLAGSMSDSRPVNVFCTGLQPTYLSRLIPCRCVGYVPCDWLSRVSCPARDRRDSAVWRSNPECHSPCASKKRVRRWYTARPSFEIRLRSETSNGWLICFIPIRIGHTRRTF